MDGHRVVAFSNRPVGSRDVAMTGGKTVLEEALGGAIEELLQRMDLRLEDIEAVVASGMITSNMGLVEIPHLAAPAGLQAVAEGMASHLFSAIANRPIHFIPGIKSQFEDAAGLTQKDMMRGEEAEVFGYLSQAEAPDDDILFMHYGSHHKAIRLSGGQIRGSSTSMTGELMVAIAQNTILKSNLVAPAEMRPRIEDVRSGLEMAESSGFGRALFSSRIMHVLEKRDRQEATGVFLGALVSLDLAMLKNLITPDIGTLVLYGKALFPAIFEPIVKERYPRLRIVALSEHESDELSARGAAMLYYKHVAGPGANFVQGE